MTDHEPSESTEPTEPTEVSPVEPTTTAEPHPFEGYRPSVRGLALWLLLLAGGVLVDGIVGAIPALVTAVVVLAMLHRSLIGGVGVGALLLAPLAVLLESRPGDRNVSQQFVLDTMLGHHLTFVGLTCVVVGVVLEVLHRRQTHPIGARPVTGSEPLDDWSTGARVALVAVVSVCAVAASVAVWSS